ncbi:MAG: hypothetical protein K8R59_13100 [Thermoanaerobaculales bacterium]|nr:hypothetical protein [Thermoanaerobaculales bacterium]
MDPRIDELRTLLREEPGSRRFFQLGELLRKENDLAGAEGVLQAGLEHHPRYVAAWVSLGRVRMATAEYGKAEQSFAHALELDPENAVAARLIGETAEIERDWVRAVKAFKLARALSPRDPDLDFKISQMELRLVGEPDEAEPVAPSVDSVMVGAELTASDEITQVFDVPESGSFFADQAGSEPADFSAVFSREVFALSDDDPFAVTPSGNTGVFELGEDVFAPSPVQEPSESVLDSPSDEIMESVLRVVEEVATEGSTEEPLPAELPIEDFPAEEIDVVPSREEEDLPEVVAEAEGRTKESWCWVGLRRHLWATVMMYRARPPIKAPWMRSSLYPP